MFLLKTVKLLVVILFFIANCSFSQTKDISTLEAQCEAIIDKGDEAASLDKYGEALEFYTDAEAIATEHKLINKLCKAKNYIGNIYQQLSNYGEALRYYKEVLYLAQNDDEMIETVPVALSNIGLVYSQDNDYKTALEYFMKGYSIAKKEKYSYDKLLLAINISDVYNKLGDFASAQKYLNEVESLPKSGIFERSWKINYAESLFLEGRVKEAQHKLEDILSSADRNDIASITELLSKIYSKQNHTALAISYAKKGLERTHALEDRIKLYVQLTNLYTQRKEFAVALKYKDSVLLSKDSLSESINRGHFETNKVELKIQEYKNELQINKNRLSAERKFFIVSTILGGVLLFGM